MINVKTLPVGSMQSNCYIVYSSVTLHCVVIDPGDEGDKIIDVIESLNLSVDFVILTHGHFDHIGAVDTICEKYNVGIIINKNDEICLKDINFNLSGRFPAKNVIVRTDNITSVENCNMNLLGQEFNFISTPGHTNGSMCIAVDDHLFTGDTLFRLSIGNQFPPYGNIKTEIDSIKNKLFTLNKDYTCYPGHGETTTLFYEKSNNPYVR